MSISKVRIRHLSSGLLMVAMLTPGLALAQQTVQEKLSVLESNIQVLQQQILALKQQIDQDASNEHTQRLAKLEAYAVQLHDVLSDLKEQVEENSTELAQATEAESKRINLKVYGTVTAGKRSDQNSVIDGQSFELVLSGQPHERLGFFTELEFERAATVGGSRGGEVLLEQAYTDLTLKPWLNFRAGVLLLPFGNIERDHYAPLRDVISKPYTSLVLAPSDWTDNGFGFNGRFMLGNEWFADYQTYVVAGLGNGISERGLRDTRQGFGVDNNNNKAFVGKFSVQNSNGFTLGFSGYHGAWDDDSSRYITGYNLDFDWQIGWLELVGEYTNMDVDRPLAGSARMDGYYLRSLITLSHFLQPGWLGKSFPHARLNFVTQYDTVDIENFFDPAAANTTEERYTLGFQLRPTPSWVANINYETANASGPGVILLGDSSQWLFSIGYLF